MSSSCVAHILSPFLLSYDSSDSIFSISSPHGISSSSFPVECTATTTGRGNVLDDCVRRRRVVEPGQTRHNAQAHYEARGHISSGGFNSGILPLCDGESCDGQDPFG